MTIEQLRELEAKAMEKLRRIRKRIRQKERQQRDQQALRYASVFAEVIDAGKPLPSEKELAQLLLKRRSRKKR
jgi:hypothetical protein